MVGNSASIVAARTRMRMRGIPPGIQRMLIILKYDGCADEIKMAVVIFQLEFIKVVVIDEGAGV